MEADVVLRTDNYGRRFGRTWAVRHVTFGIPKGSVTALVGPNGAGKSTVLRGCVGFERPDEGRILIDGAEPARSPTVLRSQIAYMPQALGLYGVYTAEDHFDLAQISRPTFDRQLARSILDRASVDPRRSTRDLSGGQQAQVGLALALGTRAPVLLLDEPLASLDPLARRTFIRALLDGAGTDGATVVLSSHLVVDIEPVCDRIVVLGRGTVVLDATLEATRREFRVLPSQSQWRIDHLVGSFTGPTGDHLSLVRGDEVGREPTLEEVVLGHLAGDVGTLS